MSDEEVALRLTEIYYTRSNNYVDSEIIVETYKHILIKLKEDYI